MRGIDDCERGDAPRCARCASGRHGIDRCVALSGVSRIRYGSNEIHAQVQWTRMKF